MIDLKALMPPEVKDILENEQKRMYLILGTTAVLAALYVFFLIVPKFSLLAVKSREIIDLNDKIDVVSDRVKRLNSINARIKGLEEELGGYTKGLPDEKEIPRFLENLSSVAKISNVKILGITPSSLKTVITGGKESAYYREMTITILARSGYHQLGQFINNLETGERFIAVENLEIQKDSKSPRTQRVKLALKTYVSVEEDDKKK